MPRALHAILAAVIILIALPVSQLRTVSVRQECCCPDPAKCHCPDHDPNDADQPSMKACHKSSQLIVGQLASEVQAPPLVAIAAPARRISVAQFSLSVPHEPPTPARPPGPS